MPYYPLDEDKQGHNYDIVTYWEHMVSEYTGLNMLEVEDLDYIDYLQLRRDAFIYRLSQSEKGLEYLDNAYRISQTRPDKASLREKFGKMEG